MALTRQEVEHIAQLARMELSEEEAEKLTHQLSSILDYVAQLQEVDTSGISYHYQVAGLENVMDEDEVHQCSEEERTALLAAMPQRVGDFLKVHGVFKE